MGPLIRHVLRIGTTRQGKSESCLLDNAPVMRWRNRPAMLILDPPGTMAKEFLAYAIKHGLTPRTLEGEPTFIYDEIARTDRCPQYPVLIPSANPDPDQADAENRLTMDEAKGLAVQAEGLLGTGGKPATDDALTDVFSLFLYQRPGGPPKDFLALTECFRFGEAARNLLSGCTRPDIVRKFARYHAAHEREWEFLCGAANRRLRKLADSPQFRKRCNGDPEFWRRFFNRGGVLILDGASKRNLSRTDLTLVVAMALRMAFMLARDGLERELWVIGDEGQTASFLDDNVAVAASEAGKWGIKLDFSLQKPQHHNRNVQESLQNYDSIRAFKQVNPDSVRLVAELFAQPNFDPMAVHYVERRVRTVEEDPRHWERVDTESKSVSLDPEGNTRSEGTTTGFVFHRPRREVTDEVARYKSPELQRREYEQKLASLGPGECLVRDGNRVSVDPVQLPMLPKPWEGLWFKRHPRVPLADEKRRLALEFMRQHAEYQTSSGGSSPWAPPPSTSDAASKLDAGEL